MTKVEAFAPAKINLALHVTGQRPDGYHLLDSLVVFANFGDRLEAELADDNSLRIVGPMAEGVPDDARNLVLKAALRAGVTARFQLEKNLPAAAGIGGGSSDAAATLRALTALSGKTYDTGLEALGADVPACYFGRACRMSGIGEVIEPWRGLPGLPAVLVNPGIDVGTAEVFQRLSDKNGAALPDEVPTLRSVEDVAGFLSAHTRNDLEAPAIAYAPKIAEVLDQLAAQMGARFVRMSGSGATCFALFASIEAAEAAALLLMAQHRDWWVQPVWLA
ncbi:4-(cytidine 5'-diphospho)-2-C-methyl-D-erythritol kinase [Lentibacter algarum]|nr:4-(cytidine 5'-diphospho)-2-C-methyl-D-erythritol kinase [Lentibacter algarum]MBU2981859.1 4-(cytidine 5'-diphospho)-2-C-methyl-D-erythritol kinase [Lentibacter algarum]